MPRAAAILALVPLLAVAVAGCAMQRSYPPNPFGGVAQLSQAGQGGRPAVIAPGSPQAMPRIYCPPALVAQSQRTMAQLARVRLGSDKMTVQSLLGSPLRAETFLLQNGGAAEVLYYPTPGSACGRADAMLPMVFQNNRLIGYGPDYYRNFVVPTLQTPLSIPASAAPSSAPVQQAPLPQSNGGSYPTGRFVQEDLPAGPTSAPYRDYAPQADERAPAYQLSPQFQQQYPPQPSLGIGQPLGR